MSLPYLVGALWSFSGLRPDGTIGTFSFSGNRFWAEARATGNLSVFNNGWFVPGVCLNPTVIHCLSRHNGRFIYNYIGTATTEFADDYGIDVEPLPERTQFSVTVTDECEVLTFRPEYGGPETYPELYGTQIWP